MKKIGIGKKELPEDLPKKLQKEFPKIVDWENSAKKKLSILKELP